MIIWISMRFIYVESISLRHSIYLLIDMYLCTAVQPRILLKIVHPNSSHLIIATLKKTPTSSSNITMATCPTTTSLSTKFLCIGFGSHCCRLSSNGVTCKKLFSWRKFWVGFLSFMSPEFFDGWNQKNTSHKYDSRLIGSQKKGLRMLQGV